MTRNLVLVILLLAACGDDSDGKHLPLPTGVTPGSSAPPAARPPAGSQPPSATAARSVRSGGSTPASAPTTSDPAKEAVLELARKRPFNNEDFIESSNNRDPFHSYLGELSGTTASTAQYKILMPRSALEELKLLAIIGPPTRGYEAEGNGEGAAISNWGAMFRDSTGVGVWVSRGDHISRADAKVTRITSDRVYVEVQEDVGSGKLRLVERAIELHAGEAQEGP